MIAGLLSVGLKDLSKNFHELQKLNYQTQQGDWSMPELFLGLFCAQTGRDQRSEHGSPMCLERVVTTDLENQLLVLFLPIVLNHDQFPTARVFQQVEWEMSLNVHSVVAGTCFWEVVNAVFIPKI